MECSICLNHLSEKGEVAGPPAAPPPKRVRLCNAEKSSVNSTPCGHLFHRTCILDWISKGNTTCPICRKERLAKQQLRAVFLTMSPSKSSTNTSACANKQKANLEAKIDSMEREMKNQSELRKKEVEAAQVELQKLDKYKDDLEESQRRERSVQAMLTRTQKERDSLEETKKILEARITEILRRNLELQADVLVERDRVEEERRKFQELAERHKLLMDDVDELKAKSLREEEKANIMQGRVISLEAALEASRNRDEYARGRGILPSFRLFRRLT